MSRSRMAAAKRMASGLCLLLLVAGLAACAMPSYSSGGGGPPYTVSYVNTTVYTTGSPPVDGTQYAAGAMVTVLGAGSLAWLPYHLINWNTQNNGGFYGGGGGTTYAFGDSFAINSNVTLYGHWQ